jgi:hypothetical protein
VVAPAGITILDTHHRTILRPIVVTPIAKAALTARDTKQPNFSTTENFG